MSQKTNPLSLRLQKGNRHFSSPWFTDSFFSDTIQYELMIRKYVAFLLQETQHSLAFFSTKKHYRKVDITFSIQDNRAEKKEKQLLFNLKSRLSYKKPSSDNILSSESFSIVSTKQSTNFFKKKVRNELLKYKLNPRKASDSCFALSKAFVTASFPLPMLSLPEKGKSVNDTIIKGVCLKTTATGFTAYHTSLEKAMSSNSLLNSQRSLSSPEVAPMTIDKCDTFLSNEIFKDRLRHSNLLTYCEKIVKQEKHRQHNEEKFASTLRFEPIRFVNTAQSVTALLDRIVGLLEKRVSFKDIKVKAFKDVENVSFIKGIRFTCSGRLGGRSKKAQKAKMQTYQWGETTLNAFSSNVVFANKSASTPYGKVGVKIWLSFTF
uniref:30S ribosomal protein S3 n=1 Tax=Jaagichlorella roystonensis TaxID=1052852 RepID=A0A6C0M732_9CHLO|nr:30S ribosomal protein S3 [Jaagichlorella roystonensis]QHU78339.1 30S ribosomal protein S3 [Jaagichlorella roystonensis]